MNRYRIRGEERADSVKGRTDLIASMGFTVRSDSPLSAIFGVALNAIRMFAAVNGWVVLHDEERAELHRGRRHTRPTPSVYVPPPGDAT